MADEYTGAPDGFHERHYHEFATFRCGRRAQGRGPPATGRRKVLWHIAYVGLVALKAPVRLASSGA